MIYNSNQVSEQFGLVDDITNLPGKIEDGFINVGKEIIRVGGNVVDGIKDVGENVYSKASDFAPKVKDALETVGSDGLNFADDVKDKIIEGGTFMINKGVPFLKNSGKNILGLLKIAFWICILIGLVILFKILNIGARIAMKAPGLKNGLPAPIAFGIMGIITVLLLLLIRKMYSIVSKLPSS